MKTSKVIAIKIILPFWLRWAKRFIKLEQYSVEQEGRIVGYQFNTTIIDDMTLTTDEEARAYADKLLHLKPTKRKENIGKFV